MTYWTIENVGVTGGAEKPIAAWGIDDLEATFTSQAEDVVTVSAAGRKIDAAYLFPFKSTVIIRRDRALSGGGYSGGSTYFRGIVAHPHVAASGRREMQRCELVGPWWYLNERGFEQEYKEVLTVINGVPTYKSPNPTRARVFLNLELGTYGQPTINKLTTGEQLTEALNWARKPFIDASETPPFQVGTIGIAVDAPVDEVKNITCAEAVRKMMRWSPDAVSWFDYTTTPPTFNVKRRAALTVFNLDLTVQRPTSVSVVPRFDLQRPFVKVQFERTDTEDGVTLQRLVEEVYPNPPPTGALNQFAGLPFVVDLRGYTRTTQPSVELKTMALTPGSLTWWLANEPGLKSSYGAGVSTIEIVTGDPDAANNPTIVLPDGETDLELPNQLVEGAPADWTGKQFQRLTVKCKANITWANGAKQDKRTLSVQVMSTDATTGVYGGGQSVDEGDPQPVGLAQDFYNAVAHVPYEGQISFRTEELGGLPALGHKLNLLGSANTDWATMATIVQRVTENVQARTTQIEFGTPPHLELADMVALLRVTRNRDPQNPYSIRVGGGSSAATGGGFKARSAWANATSAYGTWSRLVVKQGSTTIDHDADSGKSQWGSGSDFARISLADVAAALAPREAYFREFRWRDRNNNCLEMRAWILMTEPEEVPEE
jgi:hypothetical protein